MNEIRNLIIGLEIGESVSRIAVYDRKMRDAVSISTSAGMELFDYPTAMTVMPGDGAAKIGREAAYYADRGGVPIRNLYALFHAEENVPAGGRMLSSAGLFRAFLEESLGYLGIRGILENVEAIAVTTETLSEAFTANAKAAFGALFPKSTRCFIIDNEESFYYYCMYSNTEAWRKDTVLVTLRGMFAQFIRLNAKQNVTPVTVSTRRRTQVLAEGEKDRSLARAARDILAGGETGVVYLTGDPYTAEDYPETTEVLCDGGRRVFAGSNLFVRGACFASLDRTEKEKLKGVLFLGQNVVRCNVGMFLMSGERRIYYPLVTAGRCWYEEKAGLEIRRLPADRLELRVTSMDGDRRETQTLPLDGMPQRPEGAGRVRIDVVCRDAEFAEIRVTDLGFGELFPSSGKTWTAEVDLIGSREGMPMEEEKDGPVPTLCTTPRARVPFRIESIGVDVWSIEEVSYVLTEYPALASEDLLGGELAEWFRSELGQEKLWQTLRADLAEGGNGLSYVMPILKTASYLTPQEIREYKETFRRFRELPVLERTKKRGDALAGYGKYTAALNAYRSAEVIAEGREKTDTRFMSSLYYNMGAVYMQLLLFEEALACFKKSYIRFHTRPALRNYLMAAAMAKPRSKYEEIVRTIHVDAELLAEIDDAVSAAVSYEPEIPKDSPENVVRALMEDYRASSGIPVFTV
ncbi:MAG: tetratricopeptide repeat protein [Lachnospiraceae bacterium]|nr:tetratricopeptide repeat protein [Lachnospiraceae bacterium]